MSHNSCNQLPPIRNRGPHIKVLCFQFEKLLLKRLQNSRSSMSGILTLSQQTIMERHHFSLVQHETEKLQIDIETMRTELRFGFT